MIQQNILNSDLILVDGIDPSDLPCVYWNTRIVTDQDEVCVQDLAPGDRILTPTTGFDVVVDVIRMTSAIDTTSLMLSFPQNRAGNHTELNVSLGCTIYRGYNNTLGGPKFIYTDVEAQDPASAIRRIGDLNKFFCVVLRAEKLMMANGAIVSAINNQQFLNTQSQRPAYQLRA